MMYIVNYVIVTRPSAQQPVPVSVPKPSAPVFKPISPPKPEPVFAPMPVPAPLPVQTPQSELSEFYDFTSEPVAGTSALTYEDYDQYGLGMFYDPLGMVMGLCSNLLLLILLAIIINILLFWGILYLFALFKKKECMCPKCKKVIIYKGKKPLRCQYCGAKLKEKLEAH